MAQITIKTDVKIGTSPVPISDISVKFDAVSVTEPITIPANGNFPYALQASGQVPFMLVIIPMLDKDAPALRAGDLTYNTTAPAPVSPATEPTKDQLKIQPSITATQLFFNNSLPALGQAQPKIIFWNTTDLPVKLQIVAAFSPKAPQP